MEGKLSPEDWQWSCEVCREFNRSQEEQNSTAEIENATEPDSSGLTQPVMAIELDQDEPVSTGPDPVESEPEPEVGAKIEINNSQDSESDGAKRNSDIENESSSLANGESGNDVTVISDSDDDIRHGFYTFN